MPEDPPDSSKQNSSQNPPPSLDKKGINWTHTLVGVAVGIALSAMFVLVYTTVLGVDVFKEIDRWEADYRAYQEQIEKESTSSDQADETADWKVYRDEELKFEIKYPARYKSGYGTARTSDPDLLWGFGNSKSLPNLLLSGRGYGIEVADLESKWYRNYLLLNYAKDNDPRKSNVKKFIVGGVEGERFYFKYPNYNYEEDVVIIKTRGKIFKFGSSATDDDRQEASLEFEKILSTFKFLSSTGSE